MADLLRQFDNFIQAPRHVFPDKSIIVKAISIGFQVIPGKIDPDFNKFYANIREF